jgi:hypothetical protein
VTRLLTEQIDELAALWHDLGGQRTDVLAQDLPEWLANALVGGKRLRPAMCHWGYVAAGTDLDGPGHSEMIKAATALELLHQFALLHDDVMDESDLRRGAPAAHRQAERWHADAGARGDAPRSDETLLCCSATLRWCKRIGWWQRLARTCASCGTSCASSSFWASAAT